MPMYSFISFIRNCNFECFSRRQTLNQITKKHIHYSYSPLFFSFSHGEEIYYFFFFIVPFNAIAIKYHILWLFFFFIRMKFPRSVHTNSDIEFFGFLIHFSWVLGQIWSKERQILRKTKKYHKDLQIDILNKKTEKEWTLWNKYMRNDVIEYEEHEWCSTTQIWRLELYCSLLSV